MVHSWNSTISGFWCIVYALEYYAWEIISPSVNKLHNWYTSYLRKLLHGVFCLLLTN